MANILSSIAGKIMEINVEIGQSITADDEAFTIEAMKMENLIYGDDGIVREILVKVGEIVGEDQLLALID